MAASDLQEQLLSSSSTDLGASSDIDPLGFHQLRATLDAWLSKAQQKKKPAEDRRAPWRKKLGEVLESTTAHVVILVLLLVDLLATAVDILRTLRNDSHDLTECVALVESCQCTSHFEESESWEFLFWIGITILCILVVNILGLLVAFGFSFFKHPGYVLDLVVVVTALCLELFLDSETAGLLVILNLWRIIRVAHGIFEVTDEAWEKEIHKLETQLQAVEAAHNQELELIRRKDGRIAELEMQLGMAKKAANFADDTEYME